MINVKFLGERSVTCANTHTKRHNSYKKFGENWYFNVSSTVYILLPKHYLLWSNRREWYKMSMFNQKMTNCYYRAISSTTQPTVHQNHCGRGKSKYWAVKKVTTLCKVQIIISEKFASVERQMILNIHKIVIQLYKIITQLKHGSNQKSSHIGA